MLNNFGMTPLEAELFFKSKAKIALALGITAPAVSEWFAKGRIPIVRQYQLELASEGQLRADMPAKRIPSGSPPAEAA